LVIEVKHAPRYMPSTENRKKKQRWDIPGTTESMPTHNN
jgi:hypothetical protein